jgi:hypothetical protein
MSNKKQSSVEWLEQQLNVILKQSNIEIENVIWQQAKAMHKEEIANAWNDGHSEGIEGGYCTTYEEYYNKTFNK